MILLLAGFSRAEGLCPSNNASVAAQAEQAVAAFIALDAAALNAADSSLAEAVGCLSEPISTLTASAAHRARALSDFVNGDRMGAREAFATVRHLEPGYEIPLTWVPARHPLRVLYAEAKRPSGPGIGLDAEALVDGLRGSSVPNDRPVIVQSLGADDTVLNTRWSMSTRAASAMLGAIEVQTVTLSAEDDARPLILTLQRVSVGQADCTTRTRALYDLGVVHSRMGDADPAEAAFTAASLGARCAPEYAQRANAALESKKLAQTRPKPTHNKVWVGVGLGFEAGAHAQSRKVGAVYTATGELVEIGGYEYQSFGAGPSLTLDLRAVPWQSLELGGSVTVSSARVKTTTTVACDDGSCSQAQGSSAAANLFDVQGYAAFMLAPQRWTLKPLMRVGGGVRTVRGSSADNGAMMIGEVEVNPDEPSFENAYIGQLVLAPGLRWPLGDLLAVEFEHTITYAPVVYKDDLPLDYAGPWSTAGMSRLSMRPTVMLRTGF